MTSVFTVANLLTILRLALVPVFVGTVFYQHFRIALAIFFVAAVTDGLDGLVARTFNQKTPLGEILDPIADKLLLVSAFVVLSIQGVSPTTVLPTWLTAAVITRDILILLGALIVNFTTGLNRFPPSLPGKVNTLIQVITVVIFLALKVIPQSSIPFSLPLLLSPLYYLTFGMALFSGLHYIYFVNRNIDRQL
ncbi:MAG: CDP-alcohol phosphatidyltransferase family protein [Acidobacteria bacterium]|nr:CDP-alcohol phosphatidyltransferase family protein [Acidobacteriota bacterium]